MFGEPAISKRTFGHIKVVPRRESASDGQVFRFRAEIRADRRIVHHGVISIVDEGVLDDPTILGYEIDIPPGSPYIVMEWAPDGHLGDRAQGMEWAELKTVLLSLLEASKGSCTRYCPSGHQTPEQLSADGRLIIDFGVAFESESEQIDPARGKIVGSPNFITSSNRADGGTMDLGQTCTQSDVSRGY